MYQKYQQELLGRCQNVYSGDYIARKQTYLVSTVTDKDKSVLDFSHDTK